MVSQQEKSIDSVEKTLAQLARLSLDVDATREGPSDAQQSVSFHKHKLHMPTGETNSVLRRPNLRTSPAVFNSRPHSYRNKYRCRPYVRPQIKYASASNDSKQHTSSSSVETLSHIKLDKIEDIDELKLMLILSPTNCCRCAESCAMQASRSPVDEGVAGEVAELAEYFWQFVAMKLKMSSLAESMYV
uniref:Peroxide-inducible transcript 1 protein n=1 Tax=Ascaris lumbricoides TaxID=6252 RepID=A0A0M3HWS5_ASCLU